MDNRVERTGRHLVITGDGKGKTTAALGMVLRASGHGLSCLVLQFLKSDSNTGEVAAVERLPGVTVELAGLGFLPPANAPSFSAHCAAAHKGLNRLREAVQAGRHDMLVLDEICTAVARGVLSDRKVLDDLAKVPSGMHVILTGRGATPALLQWADTATEMKNLHHGLSAGLGATAGIEY
jgi:cob(I)alamin adenosyltransferase